MAENMCDNWRILVPVLLQKRKRQLMLEAKCTSSKYAKAYPGQFEGKNQWPVGVATICDRENPREESGREDGAEERVKNTNTAMFPQQQSNVPIKRDHVAKNTTRQQRCGPCWVQLKLKLPSYPCLLQTNPLTKIWSFICIIHSVYYINFLFSPVRILANNVIRFCFAGKKVEINLRNYSFSGFGK